MLPISLQSQQADRINCRHKGRISESRLLQRPRVTAKRLDFGPCQTTMAQNTHTIINNSHSHATYIGTGSSAGCDLVVVPSLSFKAFHELHGAVMVFNTRAFRLSRGSIEIPYKCCLTLQIFFI